MAQPKMIHTKTQTTKKLQSHKQIIRESESKIPLPLPEVSRVAQLSKENRPKMADFLQKVTQMEWTEFLAYASLSDLLQVTPKVDHSSGCFFASNSLVPWGSWCL